EGRVALMPRLTGKDRPWPWSPHDGPAGPVVRNVVLRPFRLDRGPLGSLDRFTGRVVLHSDAGDVEPPRLLLGVRCPASARVHGQADVEQGVARGEEAVQ